MILENRNDALSPIITLIENGRMKWIFDTDTRNTQGYESTRFWEISDLAIIRDCGPIKLRFTAHWTYGAEAGSMEIDKENRENSLCLSCYKSLVAGGNWYHAYFLAPLLV